MSDDRASAQAASRELSSRRRFVNDSEMPFQSLGSTGLRVSRLGLRLAALGRPAYNNLGRSEDFGHQRSVADLQRRCHDMLNAAYAAGCRYVDAPRSYGMAEAFLGTWLSDRNLPADAITIGSKWGYTYVGLAARCVGS